jgi:hypothetical protein
MWMRTSTRSGRVHTRRRTAPPKPWTWRRPGVGSQDLPDGLRRNAGGRAEKQDAGDDLDDDEHGVDHEPQEGGDAAATVSNQAVHEAPIGVYARRAKPPWIGVPRWSRPFVAHRPGAPSDPVLTISGTVRRLPGSGGLLPTSFNYVKPVSAAQSEGLPPRQTGAGRLPNGPRPRFRGPSGRGRGRNSGLGHSVPQRSPSGSLPSRMAACQAKTASTTADCFRSSSVTRSWKSWLVWWVRTS